MKNIISKVFVAATIVFTSATASFAQATATASATATIITPISISKTVDMN
ncbi:MAG: hypothetical protein JWQ38_1004, partial [Flavipsychrobacter sp.]|nr:hypothetical protein [Flavipsychrobacter sp.]